MSEFVDQMNMEMEKDISMSNNAEENVPEDFKGERYYLSIVQHVHQGATLLGVAYYSDVTEIVSVGQFNDFEAISMLKQNLLPVCILTNVANNSEFHTFLKRNELQGENLSFNVICLKKSEFAVDTAKSRLNNLKIEDMKTHTELPDRNQHMLNLMSILVRIFFTID